MFYYATDVGLDETAQRDGRLRKRLQELANDALSVAEQAGFDVFNALTLMDNIQFLEDLKVGAMFLNNCLRTSLIVLLASSVPATDCLTSTCTIGGPLRWLV